MACMFPFFDLQILKEIRLGGFEVLDVFRIGYFELVFDLVYQTCKNSCIYAFSTESLSSYDVLTYNHAPRVH